MAQAWSLILLKPMNALNDIQVIQYLRAKAITLNSAADALEGKAVSSQSTEPKVSARPIPVKEQAPFNLVSGQATPESIQGYLAKKGARIADLAKHFNCSEATILAIIQDPSSGIEMAERGWLKISDQQTDQ